MNDEVTGGEGVSRQPAVNAANRPGDPSRRAFLKQTGALAASTALVGLGVAGLVAGPAFPTIAEAGGVIMPDPGLCIGCLTCEVACSDVHREAGLSDVPRIRIYNRADVLVQPQIIASFGERGHFFQHVCVQCPDAPCLPVCPVDGSAYTIDTISGNVTGHAH